MKKWKPFLATVSLLGLAAFSSTVSADQSKNAVISKSAYRTESKSFDVVGTQSANGKSIQELLVAIWSEENGQDDICWYTDNGSVPTNIISRKSLWIF